MDNYMLLIPMGIVLIFIIIIIVYLVKRSKKTDEQPSSILDVNEVGVPTSSEFSYGYEKEETVVMNPINTNVEESENEKNDSTLNQSSDIPAEDNTIQDDIENNISTNDEDSQEIAENQTINEEQNVDMENRTVDDDAQDNNESEEI